MKLLNTHSIIFKTALIYFFLTLLNISIFVLMVFENQLDLIAENAVLSSQHKGSSLKYRIDHVLAGERGDLALAAARGPRQDHVEMGRPLRQGPGARSPGPWSCR